MLPAVSSVLAGVFKFIHELLSQQEFAFFPQTFPVGIPLGSQVSSTVGDQNLTLPQKKTNCRNVFKCILRVLRLFVVIHMCSIPYKWGRGRIKPDVTDVGGYAANDTVYVTL